MEETKVCSKCGESLPVSCFNKDKQKRCGLTGSCKACNNKRRIELYTENNQKTKATYYEIKKKDPEFKLKKYRRHREYAKKKPHLFYHRQLLNNTLKPRKTTRRRSFNNPLGYGHEELKKHLEGLFIPGMNWGNRGLVWEIDHIKPVVKFDRSESPAVVNALSNIRPLWKTDNLKKKDKWLT